VSAAKIFGRRVAELAWAVAGDTPAGFHRARLQAARVQIANTVERVAPWCNRQRKCFTKTGGYGLEDVR
jgi:hypothetical protein